MNSENNSLNRTYFIGGPPRVGKSVLAYSLARKIGGHVVSTDSIRNAAKKACTDKDSDLFIVNKNENISEDEWLKVHLERPQEVVDYQNKESIALWPSVISFCNSFVEDSEAHIVEGVGILPSLVSKMENIPKHVVFVGNTNKKPEAIIKYMEDFPEQDWMASMEYGKEKIAGMTNFINTMSQYFKEEAEKYGFAYYEIGDNNFKDSIENIINILTKSEQ